MALRAAREWGTEPEVYLGRKDPGTGWSLKSRALAEGLLLHEDSLNQYGIPIREATDPEMDGFYEIDDSTIDYVEAAVEDYRKNTKDPEPGVQLRIVNTWVPDEERPEGARRPRPLPKPVDSSLGDQAPGLPKEPSL